MTDQLHASLALTQVGKPDLHWIGSWVDPTACMDAVPRRKILVSAGNRTPVIQSVASHTTD